MIVVGPRGSGKTIALIEWLINGSELASGHWSRAILVSSTAERSRVQAILRRHHHSKPVVAAVYADVDKVFFTQLPPSVELAVDDVEFLIVRMLKRNVVAITVTHDAVRLLSAPSIP